MAKGPLPQILFDFSDENEQEPAAEQEFLSGRPIPVPVEKPKGKRGRKSLKALEEEADLVNVPPDEELFQKQYYAIGEVAQMFKETISQLRYWENEFDIQAPSGSPKEKVSNAQSN